MNDLSKRNDVEVFASAGLINMADVMARVEASPPSTGRRDTLSAFRTASKALDIDWRDVTATPNAVQRVLNERCAAELGLSDTRWRNVCSLIRKAFETHAGFNKFVTRRIPHSEAWQALLATIPTTAVKHRKDGLTRLACYCSALQLTPDQLSKQVLLRFYEALVEEEVLKDPKQKLKHTIACWNMCLKNVPGWPDIRLGSPFESTHYSLPLADFPKSFQADVTIWRERCLYPDIMDEDSAPRALKTVTVDGQVSRLVRFASVLVQTGTLEIDEITGFDVLVSDIDRIKAGLRFFLARNDGKSNASTFQMGAILRAVAKYQVKVPTELQDKIDNLAKNLRVDRLNTLTPKNRRHLKQFDKTENVANLLAFPEQEAAYARTLNNPHRRAKAFERAVAVKLLIVTSMRAKNIRSLRMDTDIQFVDDHGYISVSADDVKNGMQLDFELPTDLIALLREYIAEFRPDLPGSGSNFLFPGQNGGPRPHNSLFDNLMDRIRRRTGLQMNAHLFRHLICKLVVESDPGMALSASRHLGHKQPITTMQRYLGTEGRAVSKRIDKIVNQSRATFPTKRRKR